MQMACPYGPGREMRSRKGPAHGFDMGGCPKSRKGSQIIEKYGESELTPQPQNGVLQRHSGVD
jgi:hypothetical protein